MWRKFDIPTGKWEFWFGNFPFFCHIWKTLIFKRLGGSQTRLHRIHLHIITPDPGQYPHTPAMGFGICSHLFYSQRKGIQCTRKLLHCFYFLRFFFFLNTLCCLYCILPYFHNLCKYQTGALETNIFNDSKMLGERWEKSHNSLK